jgi:hypothetical protein
MDAKARVAAGDFSRDGESRGAETTKVLDHDPDPKQKLVPRGICLVREAVRSYLAQPWLNLPKQATA